MVFEMQIFGNQDMWGQVAWFLLFFVFIFIYPRLMLMQVMFQLDRTVKQLEDYTHKGRSIAIHKASKAPSKNIRESISNFLDFFVIEPVALDPAGVVGRIEHLMNLSERRFKYFVKNVAPNLNKEEQANMTMTLAGAISLNQIMKTVRHFVEIARKTRNLQIAMILQMQLPFIEKISRAMLRGTEAFANGWPVGDSVGPLIASHMIEGGKARDIADDETIVVNKKIKGRNVFIIRAKGPGGRLGKLGRAVEILSRKRKIAKIISIDAAAKLEGERTGNVAEGVGVAIGGIGVDRSYIEKIATERDLPLDSVVVKMSQEEAIMPMKMEVLQAVPRVIKIVENNIAETDEKGDIIVVGVGNCTGIGNTKKEAAESEELIKRNAMLMKREEKAEEKERGRLINKIFGM
jgi:hypothetical protein